MSGRFRGDLWFDKHVHRRTMSALRGRGIHPDEEHPRRSPEYKAEYRRQAARFRQEREAKKAELRRKHQAESAALLAAQRAAQKAEAKTNNTEGE